MAVVPETDREGTSRRPLIRFEDVVDLVAQYYPEDEADYDLLRRAYVFSARVHRGQTRKSGEPYLIHPLAVAHILAELRLDCVTIATGLLHDVVEDTLTEIDEIERYFGEHVAHIVAGVTKITHKMSEVRQLDSELTRAESFRKMMLAMVDDIRVIFVKLADRVHNMRTLEYHDNEEKRRRIARETLQIYAPIAHRLGIGQVKHELEELGFRYAEPEQHAILSEHLERKRVEEQEFIERTQRELAEILARNGIPARIQGRLKSLYSIYRKVKARDIDVDEIYDYVAFRILTNSRTQCYGALGQVHARWKPVPGRFKDWVALAKPNGYRSLHTSLMTEEGQMFEVQIRTQEMHEEAELGIAAHWAYKAGEQAAHLQRYSGQWIRQLVEWQQELPDSRDFLEAVRLDLYPEEVYTFTPKGELKALPKGATTIDFAYAIHSEVGHRCTGAKVNGRMVPLKTELQNGDIVNILTSPGQHPRRDWLKHVATTRARSKIRHWLNVQQRQRLVALGREICERELKRDGVEIGRVLRNEAVVPALKRQGYRDGLDQFFAAVGFGKVKPRLLMSCLSTADAAEFGREMVERELKRHGMDVSRLYEKGRLNEAFAALGYEGSQTEAYGAVARGRLPLPVLVKWLDPKRARKRRSQPAEDTPRSHRNTGDGGVQVHGAEDVYTYLPKCCNPTRGDDIIGYVTRGKGVAVHRQQCPNVRSLMADPQRRIEVQWADRPTGRLYDTRIRVYCLNRAGLLAEVAAAIRDEQSNIKKAGADTRPDHRATIDVLLEVLDRAHLERIMRRILELDGVLDVGRQGANPVAR